MRRLIIIGGGGHGNVVSEIAELNGYKIINFLDDADIPKAIGKVTDFEKYINDSDFIVAIGNNQARFNIQENLIRNGANVVTLIHPKAVVSKTAVIGKGTVLMAGTVINANTKIGNGCIINTSASVDHDCIVNDYTHISVGAHLAGTVNIGQNTFIGIGAVISNNITITENCVIGAGAAVVNNILEPGTYTGVPAKELK